LNYGTGNEESPKITKQKEHFFIHMQSNIDILVGRGDRDLHITHSPPSHFFTSQSISQYTGSESLRIVARMLVKLENAFDSVSIEPELV
jgi:hypothetical protein